ncbi:MAG: transketolase [Methylococcaceae bacterium]
MLNERSKQIRRDTIRFSLDNGGYHFGGSFSIVEILIALYDYILTDDDKFILSKGHACWPWYVILRELGYDPKLEGHPSRDPHNGIHCTTGSLGHGLPSGVGIALAKKLKGEKGKVHVLMGDGECQEGTTWESLLIAAHHKLDNLVVIVDKNGIQGSGFVNDVLPLPWFGNIACTIGWDIVSIDGHGIEEIRGAIEADRSKKPKLIIANTIKGKGVSYMENQPKWHACWPNPEQEAQALRELA